MHCVVLQERKPGDPRAALTPATTAKLVKLGLVVHIEAGLGAASLYPDSEYTAAGATLIDDRSRAIAMADLWLCVNKPAPEEVARMKPDAVVVGMLDPFFDRNLVERCAAAKVTALSLEMLPRTTLAQKMDVLSSQASLAGYAAVLQTAARLPKGLPMMMTPAGTIQPCRVFVIGAGVAGLQAIATAKRLGARVEAFDTRPVVEEQVKSLGAKFVKIDLGGETGQTASGYAQALTPEQIARQQAGMAAVCAESDIVITTAKIFGRKPPRLITHAMLAGMKSGSVVADLALESGGNVEGAQPGRDVVTENGVVILGQTCYEATVAHHATQVYAANVAAWVAHFWDAGARTLKLDPADEMIKACMITHAGAVVHPQFATKLEPATTPAG